MKFLTHNAEAIALLLAPPNRTVRPKLTLTLPFTEIERGLNAQESRRTFATSSRFTYEFTPRFRTAREATEFRIALGRLKDEPIAVPLWEDSVRLTAANAPGSTVLAKTADNPVRYGAEWLVLNPDAGIFEIVVVNAVTSSTITLAAPGLTLNWSAGALMFPLLFARFSERPKLQSITPSRVSGGLKFIEHSSFARRLNTMAGAVRTVGATVPDFATTPLFDIDSADGIDFANLLDTSEAEIIYRQVGFLRGEQVQVYEQAPNRRGLEIEVVCKTRAAIAKVERLFTNRRGPVRTLMVPTFRNDLELTANLPIAGQPNRITIAASEYSNADRPAHVGDPFVAIIENVGGAVVINPQRVTNVAAGTLTTEQPIGQSHTAARSRLSHMLLARFAEPRLQWTYVTPTRARARLKFIEQPDEYEAPQAELPVPAFLYRFLVRVPEEIVLGRFTSHENAIVWAGQTWTPAPFSHGNIKRTLTLDDKTDLTSWGGNFPGNPLAKFLPLTLEGDLYVEIVEVNAEAPGDGTAEILFFGKVTRPRMKGNDWRANAVAFDHAHESRFPRFLIQKSDNFVQFTRPTGLDEDDFVEIGNITAIDGFTINVSGAAARPADWFAGGWIERGAGTTFEGRGVIHSALITGGQKLTLDRPLLIGAIGNAVEMFPGYDGSLAECIEKFGNGINFGGHPFVPDTGPQIKAADAKQANGGKKA